MRLGCSPSGDVHSYTKSTISWLCLSLDIKDAAIHLISPIIHPILPRSYLSSCFAIAWLLLLLGFFSPYLSPYFHCVGLVVCHQKLSGWRRLFWSPPEFVDPRHDVFLLCAIAAEISVPMETVHNASTAASIHISSGLHGIFRRHCYPGGQSGIETLRLLHCPNI